jgi:hypothetical protein
LRSPPTVVFVDDQPVSCSSTSKSVDDVGRNVSDHCRAVLLAFRLTGSNIQGQGGSAADTIRASGLVAQLVGCRVRSQTDERDLLGYSGWRTRVVSRETKRSDGDQDCRIGSRHWVGLQFPR